MSGQVFQDPAHSDVIILDMMNGQTWDEVDAMIAEERDMAARIAGPVAVIIDVRRAPNPPGNDTLMRARGIFAGQPKNVMLWVLLGGTRMSEILAGIVRSAGIIRMIPARTLGEAHALIDTEFARLGEETSA